MNGKNTPFLKPLQWGIAALCRRVLLTELPLPQRHPAGAWAGHSLGPRHSVCSGHENECLPEEIDLKQSLLLGGCPELLLQQPI